MEPVARLDSVSVWGSHSSGSSKTRVETRSAASELASPCPGHHVAGQDRRAEIVELYFI